MFAAPSGARLDAFYGLEEFYLARSDFKGALAMNKRWLDSSGYWPLSLPVDAWAVLARNRAVHHNDWGTVDKGDLVALTLGSRINIALLDRDHALAHRTFEEYLAYKFEEGTPEEARFWLLNIADVEHMDGDNDGARRILEYLQPQPMPEGFAARFRQTYEGITGSPVAPMNHRPPVSPWDSEPAQAPPPEPK